MIFLIYIHPESIFDGNLFDTLEYFLFSKHNVCTKSKLIVFSKVPNIFDHIKNFAIERYNRKIVIPVINDVISLYKVTDLLEYIRDQKIICFGIRTFFFLKSLNFLKNISRKIIYVSEWDEVCKTNTPDNLISLYEMPFSYGKIKYFLKFTFSYYKKIESFKDNIFTNLNYSSIPNILCKNRKYYIEKFRESFSTLLYVKWNSWINPHPRIFHECLFDKKKIILINLTKKIDGAILRYLECKIFPRDEVLEFRSLSNKDLLFELC